MLHVLRHNLHPDTTPDWLLCVDDSFALEVRAVSTSTDPPEQNAGKPKDKLNTPARVTDGFSVPFLVGTPM